MEPSQTAGGNYNVAPALKTSWAGLQNVEYGVTAWTSNFTLGIYPGEKITCVCTKTCSGMFTVGTIHNGQKGEITQMSISGSINKSGISI